MRKNTICMAIQERFEKPIKVKIIRAYEHSYVAEILEVSRESKKDFALALEKNWKTVIKKKNCGLVIEKGDKNLKSERCIDTSLRVFKV